jgi:hypothetical protein
MVDSVWKLIIFISLLNRITETSRSERATLRVYNTYATNVGYVTLGHTAHIQVESDSCHTSISMSGVTVSTVAVLLLCRSGMLQVAVAQTLCPSRSPRGSGHKGLDRGTVGTENQVPTITPSDLSMREKTSFIQR